MTRNPISVDASASILEVAEIFFTNPFKRLPVIHQQRLVGQVSRSDVLKAIDRFVQVDQKPA